MLPNFPRYFRTFVRGSEKILQNCQISGKISLPKTQNYRWAFAGAQKECLCLFLLTRLTACDVAEGFAISPGVILRNYTGVLVSWPHIILCQRVLQSGEDFRCARDMLGICQHFQYHHGQNHYNKNSLQNKCCGTINSVKIAKIVLLSTFLRFFRFKKAHNTGSNITKKILWWIFFVMPTKLIQKKWFQGIIL